MDAKYFCRAAIAAGCLCLMSCVFVSRILSTGGEQRTSKSAPPSTKSGTHVLIFALDGATPDDLMQAVHSGKAPRMQKLLGKDEGSGLFEHAYAAPHALSILPSSTVAD